MTVTVTMIRTAFGESGSLWTAGQSYSASDAFAAELIGANLATGTLPADARNRRAVFSVALTEGADTSDHAAGTILSDPSTGLIYGQADGVGGHLSISTPQTTPNRVFLLGDSLSMRTFRIASGATATGSGTDITITISGSGTMPPVGSYFRLINQANVALNADWPIVAATATTFTIRTTVADTSGVTSVSGAVYGQNSDTGWWVYAEGELAALGLPVQVIRNAGDGGDTLQEIRARIPTEIAPYALPGDIVAFMGGVNGSGADDESSLDGSTAANVVADLAGIIDDLLALGVIVHASTITQAQAAGYWTTSAATAISNTKAANGYLRGRALSDARVRVFDSYAALGGTDYAASDLETDGVHFLPSGAEKVGQRYVDDCIADYSKRTYRRVLSASDAYVDADSWNLLTNPEFTGATGTTAPTGWTASLGSGTNSLTLAARSDGIGNDLTIDKAHTSANAAVLSQDITARIAAGDLLVFGSEYETGAGSEGHYFQIALEFDIGGVTTLYQMGRSTFTYAQGGRLPPAGVRRFLEWYGYRNLNGREGVLVPAGFTAARFSYRMQLGASGSCAAVVSRPQVYKV